MECALRPTRFAIDQKIESCLYHIGGIVKFVMDSGARIPYHVDIRPSEGVRRGFLNFYESPLEKDLSMAYAEFEKIKQRVFEVQERPPLPGEFTMIQTLVMETVAHDMRIKACHEQHEENRKDMFDKAFRIYAAACIARGEAPGTGAGRQAIQSMISDCLKPPPRPTPSAPLTVFTPVTNAKVNVHPETRRQYAHCMAGMAICALFGTHASVKFSFIASGAVAWAPEDTILLSHVLRIYPLYYARFKFGMSRYHIDREMQKVTMGFDADTGAPVWLSVLEEDFLKGLLWVLVGFTKLILVPTLLQWGLEVTLGREREILPAGEWEDTMRRAHAAVKRAADRDSGAMPDPQDKCVTIHVTPEGELMERVCAHCGVMQAQGVKLFRCSKCMRLYYCSRECQVAGWPAHKERCLAFR